MPRRSRERRRERPHHLETGAATLEQRTRYTVEQVRALASVVQSQGEMGASTVRPLKTDGMVVIPVGATLAGIANG